MYALDYSRVRSGSSCVPFHHKVERDLCPYSNPDVKCGNRTSIFVLRYSNCPQQARTVKRCLVISTDYGLTGSGLTQKVIEASS